MQDSTKSVEGALREASLHSDYSPDFTLDANNRFAFTMAAGETSKSFDIAINDDSAVEGTEFMHIVGYSTSLFSLVNPIYANAEQVVLVKDNDEPGVHISSTELTVDEAGGTATYEVTLTSQPHEMARVLIEQRPSNGDPWADQAARLSPIDQYTVARFTPDNWNVAQTITVSGQDDDVDTEGDKRVVTILTRVSSSSTSGGGAEPRWVGAIGAVPITVTVLDDEVKGVTYDLEDDYGQGTEQQAVFRRDRVIVLDRQPRAIYKMRLHTKPDAPVTVTATSSDATKVTFKDSTTGSATLTFDATNWNVFQSLEVELTEAGEAGAEFDVTISHGHAGTYGTFAFPDITVSKGGYSVGEQPFARGLSRYEIHEGQSVPIRVWLKEDPGSDTSYEVRAFPLNHPDVPLSFSPDGFQTLDQSNWEDGVEWVVTADQDEGKQGKQSTQVYFEQRKDDGTATDILEPVAIVVIDREELPLEFEEAALTVGETGNRSYKARMKVSANNGVDNPVTYRPSASDATRVRLNDANKSDVSEELLRYTWARFGDCNTNPSDPNDDICLWDEYQEVGLYFPADNDFRDDVVTLSHLLSYSLQPEREGWNAGDVTVTISDGTKAGTGVGSIGGPEAGSPLTYRVSLSGAGPATETVITLASLDETVATVSPTSLTFTADNYTTGQTVTITPIDDNIDNPVIPNTNGKEGRLTTIRMTGPTGLVHSSRLPDVTVSFEDDDTAGVTVTPTSLSLDEGGKAYSSVQLTSEPTDKVTVAVAGGNTAIAAIEQYDEDGNALPDLSTTATLVFEPAQWRTPLKLAIVAPDNSLRTGARSVTLTNAVTSDDVKYNGVSAADVSVTVADDDMASTGIALTVDPASVAEGDASTPITVTGTLNDAARTEDTVVTLALAGTATSGTDYTAVTPPTLTIAAGP